MVRSALSLALLSVCVPAAQAQLTYQLRPMQQNAIVQPVGGASFGDQATGQTFTPGIGVTPDPDTQATLPLLRVKLYQGQLGAFAPSSTTFLNVYDGDPNAGGSFLGSSLNAIDTTGGLVFHEQMAWDFAMLDLGLTTEYWLVLSSTNTAGGLDVALSLESHSPGTVPGLYAGGAGLVAGITPQANSVDARFEVRFGHFSTPDLVYAIDQPSGSDSFGDKSTGQTFTPNIGIQPDPGPFTSLPLTEVTFYRGQWGASAPSPTTYLNIYLGDPNAGAPFYASSTNSIDTTAVVAYHAPMTWSFDKLPLGYGLEVWAVMSSTNTAGGLDVAVSLETQDRNIVPSLYPGGTGLIVGIAPHPDKIDAKFHVEFLTKAPGVLAMSPSGSGCASTAGEVAELGAPAPAQVGQPFQLDLWGLAPGSLPFAVLGGSDSTWALGSLPYALAALFPATPVGCDLLVRPDWLLPMVPVATDAAALTLQVPNDPQLAGLSFHVQGLQVEAVGAGLRVSTTAEGTAQIGS